MEELRSIFTVIAVLFSFWSGYTVRRLWYQANRPILSAAIKENSCGVGIVLFDLVIFNSGNRPATNIRLTAKKDDIDQIIIENVSEDKKEEIYSIFSNSSRIQLILNGENAKTAFFGYAVNAKEEACILRYEAELPLKIEYQDLDDNKFTSAQLLYIRDSEGFGGSVWQKST